ncbi:DUF6093 family protein [Nonomuraea sp. NPDC050790]|uniref:DUF6093 family protein n=1 Tax=Nonomuraea sp. NPDC050790 TaxID=3364371 RepID=UPI0037B0733B
MPLSGHTPIHPRWSEHHRPVATGTQTGTCTIRRPGTGDGTQDPDGTWHPPAPTVVYAGPCRITPQTDDARYVVSGERRVTTRGYEVAIEWDAAEILEGDHLTVDTARDPRLPDTELRVMDVRMASEQWERVLVCEQDLTDAA